MPKQTCPECKGSGVLTCWFCKGTKVMDHPSGAGIARCSHCDEDAEVGCDRCAGSGELAQ